MYSIWGWLRSYNFPIFPTKCKVFYSENLNAGMSMRYVYSKMSNNVPDKIKPFGTLRDFGAGHLGHYETFLYGHRLGPFGTLRDFFVGHYKTLWKIFLRAPRPPPLETSKNFLRALSSPPPQLESWKIFLLFQSKI